MNALTMTMRKNKNDYWATTKGIRLYALTHK